MTTQLSTRSGIVHGMRAAIAPEREQGFILAVPDGDPTLEIPPTTHCGIDGA